MTGRAGQAISGQARELGNELRRIRERARLTLREVARVLHADKSKVSRIENGLRLPSELDVAMYVALCHASEDERDRLLTLARQSGEANWLRPHGEALPEQLRSLIFQENAAQAITSYEPLIIPGLLQTEEYARELFRWFSALADDGIELRVHARIARQGLLDRHSPPWLTCFVHEHALRSPVGSRKVMHEQLMKLLLATNASRCSVRVVPHRSGPHGALGGSFRLMEYARQNPMVYVENQTASIFLEDEEDIAAYRAILVKLDSIALSTAESRAWVARLAAAFDQTRE